MAALGGADTDNIDDLLDGEDEGKMEQKLSTVQSDQHQPSQINPEVISATDALTANVEQSTIPSTPIETLNTANKVQQDLQPLTHQMSCAPPTSTIENDLDQLESLIKDTDRMKKQEEDNADGNMETEIPSSDNIVTEGLTNEPVNNEEPETKNEETKVAETMTPEEVKDEMMSTPVWSSKLADDDNYHCELLDEDNDNNEEITADSGENGEDIIKKENEDNKPKFTIFDIEEAQRKIFTSSAIDVAMMEGRDQSRFLQVPPCSALEGVKELSKTEIDEIRIKLDERESREGFKAGLGLKKRSADRMGRMDRMATFEPQLSKAKTLAEKRRKLQEDMVKYGVAAIERMYPRQGRKIVAPVNTKNKNKPKMTPYKIPSGVETEQYEEVDARQILKPWSHHKYIQEPDGRVVYVHRKDGLVPLATLTKEFKVSLSSSVSLLVERNQEMGKPSCYVRDMDRLLGIGGTRKRKPSAVKILHVPKFDHEKNPLPLFDVDDELANFAASVVKRPKVDIRFLKKQRSTVDEAICRQIDEESGNLVNKILLKLELRATGDVEKIYDELSSSRKHSFTKESKTEGSEEGKGEEATVDENADNKETDEEKIVVVKNAWKNCPNQAFPASLNMDECPPLRGFSEGNIKPILKTPLLNGDGMTGWDVCQVAGCFCSEDGTKSTDVPTPSKLTADQQNNKAAKKKLAKDLDRVKRALKTLGVNIIEYEDQDSENEACLREYCKLGCVCESIKMKPQPPTHCGKVECMFNCSCSKETLNSSLGNKKVNISAAVGARIQESSQRFLAAEERAFSNTVVLTGDKDTLLIGGSRGTKRKRKVPSRYITEEEEITDRATKEILLSDKTRKEPSLSPIEDEEIFESGVIKASESEAKRKLGLLPCSVVMPKVNVPKQTEVWCLYHCRYSCGCLQYEDPLQFAPEVTRSRNMAKRSLGGKFITKKRNLEDEEIEELIISDDETESISKTRNIKIKEGSSARTAGVEISQSSELKIVTTTKTRRKQVFQKIASAKDTNNTSTKPDNDITKLETILESKRTKQNSRPSTIVKGKTITSPVKEKINENKDELSTDDNNKGSTIIDLSPAPRQSIQYVRWDILKEKFINGDVNIYFHIRPGKGTNLLFLTSRGQSSYIASAINIGTLEGGTHNLPRLVEACLLPLDKQVDKASFGVLESNGFVWMLTSLLSSTAGGEGAALTSKLEAAAKSRKQDLNKDMKQNISNVNRPKPGTSRTGQQVGPVSQDQESTRIDVSLMSQRLPVGRSMVTVTRQEKAVMQVKLPTTSVDQYWTLVSVSNNGQPTIQCPDSTLLLKCTILQQAANLASATATTVRIPINTETGQHSSFGVYAVPGLKTHVFVGPFKAVDTSVITLVDEDIEEIGQVNKTANNDDDEIKVLDNKHETKIKQSDSKPSSKKATLAAAGQTPQMITIDEEDDNKEGDEIEILTENPKDKDKTQPEQSQAQLLNNQNMEMIKDTQALDLLHFRSGKVVLKKSKAAEQTTEADLRYTRMKLLVSPGNHTFVKLDAKTGKTEFQYPGKPDYMVLCNSLKLAKSWLLEYKAATSNNAKPRTEQQQLPKIISVTGSGQSSESTGEVTKPGFQYGTLIQSRQEKERSKLFYELGQTVLKQMFTKSTTKLQILTESQTTISALKEEQENLERTKNRLISQRTKLFQQFTKSLEGLPVDKKKIAVVNLRKLVNTLKQNKEENIEDEFSTSTQHNKDVNKSPVSVLKTRVIKDGSGGVKIVPQADNPYTQATGISTLNPDGSITPPLSSFEIWLRDKHGGKLQTNISATLRQYYLKAYNQLSDKTKARYNTEAHKLKTLHSIQHPGFRSPDSIETSTIQSSSQSSISTSNIQGVIQQARQAREIAAAAAKAKSEKQQQQQQQMSDDVLGMALKSSGLIINRQNPQVVQQSSQVGQQNVQVVQQNVQVGAKEELNNPNLVQCTQEAWEREQVRLEQSIRQPGFQRIIQHAPGVSSAGQEAEITTIDENAHEDYMVVHGSNINQGEGEVIDSLSSGADIQQVIYHDNQQQPIYFQGEDGQIYIQEQQQVIYQDQSEQQQVQIQGDEQGVVRRQTRIQYAGHAATSRSTPSSNSSTHPHIQQYQSTRNHLQDTHQEVYEIQNPNQPFSHQVYTEDSLASQGNVIHQGVGGGVPAQQQIYVDQLTGRQVILEEGAQVLSGEGADEYIIQNGQIVQIIRD